MKRGRALNWVICGWLVLLAVCFSNSIQSPVLASPTVFDGIESEPPPPKLTLNKHFLISNENHLHYFHDLVKDVGGVYLGVGSEQNYVLAGWAKSERMIIVDFDHWIVDLHGIYAYFFTRAETPAAFRELWSHANRKQIEKDLRGHFESSGRVDEIIKVFKRARPKVAGRLKRLIRQYKKSKTPSFLTDEAQYNHLVQLIQQGKLHAYRADFLGKTTLVAIGAALTQLSEKIRILYLSNIEDYFDYTPQLEKNMNALPSPEEAVVLRTHSHKYKEGWHFSYGMQPFQMFKLWLGEDSLVNMNKANRKMRRNRLLPSEYYEMKDAP